MTEKAPNVIHGIIFQMGDSGMTYTRTFFTLYDLTALQGGFCLAAWVVMTYVYKFTVEPFALKQAALGFSDEDMSNNPNDVRRKNSFSYKFIFSYLILT